MKRNAFLFYSLFIFFSIYAQRDFQLVENENFWLTSGNSASLTTFAVPTISKGEIYYEYSSGSLQDGLQGDKNNVFGVSAKSFMRFNPKIVVFGNVSYNNNSASGKAGSMLAPYSYLKPFDLIETTLENSGNKRYENINVWGEVGWNLWKSLSIGASFNFDAGIYSKFKDLRHTNTLMNIDAGINAFWNLSGYNGFGAGIIYKRTTETLKFETFGTTDKVFKTLVEYANGIGEIETYGGEGFTDSNHETPLFNDFLGVAAQGGLAGFYGEIQYLHRTGYYGKKSQYTVSYSNHSSDIFNWRLRYTLPHNEYGYLCMFELAQTSEVLTSKRTNYRKESLPENSSVTYYEYYQPTKIADKARQNGYLRFLGYWKPKGDIFLWHLNASINYIWGKQSAYIFPYIYTAKIKCINPEILAKRNILFPNSSMFTIGLQYGMQFKYLPQLTAGIEAKYELALKKNIRLRPYLSASYSYQRGTSGIIRHLSRWELLTALGLLF